MQCNQLMKALAGGGQCQSTHQIIFRWSCGKNSRGANCSGAVQLCGAARRGAVCRGFAGQLIYLSWCNSPVIRPPPGGILVLQKRSIRRIVITEKAPTRAFSWLKAPTRAFTFKTLLSKDNRIGWEYLTLIFSFNYV